MSYRSSTNAAGSVTTRNAETCEAKLGQELKPFSQTCAQGIPTKKPNQNYQSRKYSESLTGILWHLCRESRHVTADQLTIAHCKAWITAKDTKVPSQTVQILAYRDQIDQDWNELIPQAFRYLVDTVPSVRKCRKPNCSCPEWHVRLPLQRIGLPLQKLLHG